MTVQKSVLGHGIVAFDSTKAGPTVGVFCNVHGNERCGRTGLRRVLDDYEILAGKLIYVDANPEAWMIDERYVASDMNRMFTAEILAGDDTSHELARARYLAEVLPSLGLDYAIDLHSTSSPTKFPFAVCYEESEAIAAHCPVVRTMGWSSDVLPGTLIGWLCDQSVPAAVVECGQHTAAESVDIAERVLLSVLSGFGLIDAEVSGENAPTEFEVTEKVMVADASSFHYTKSYESFDSLEPGELIATDSERQYVVPSESGYSILMPAEQRAINQGRAPGAYYLIRSARTS